MRTLVVVALLLTLLLEVRAEPIEVSVPSECQSLAQQVGVPQVLHSKTQITYALYKLKRIDESHSGVSECRGAVERMKAAYRTQKNSKQHDSPTPTSPAAPASGPSLSSW